MRIFTLLAATMLFAFSSNAQLVDGDLESGTGGYWNEYSTIFGTPMCDAGCGNCGGPCFAQSGSWYAWFGGAGGAAEVGSFDQDLTIPNGSSATLTFYAKIASGGSGSTDDVLEVQMDGVTYWSITGADSAAYSSYTQVTLNVSEWADGGNHWLNIQGSNLSGSNINMMVDNLVLTVDGNVETGVTELLNRESEITVYPNPAINEVNVQFNHEMSGNAVISIYNMSGQLINKETLVDVYQKSFKLDTSDFENGLYYMEIEAGQELVTKRFMVQK